jgi:oligopeptidase B
MIDEVDAYSWMRNVEDPRLMEHFIKENDRFEEVMAPVMPLAQQIFCEIVERIPSEDTTVPYRFGRYEYSYRYSDGREYPYLLRKLTDSPEEPEILLDYQEFLDGSEFLDIQICVDRQSTVLAYAIDQKGDRIYSIRFRDLISKQDLPHCIPVTTGNMTWSSDGRILFYSEPDPATLRWRRIKRYVLGTHPPTAETVFDDAHEAFSCHVYSAKSDDFILIHRSSGTEDEVYFIPGSDPFAQPRFLQACRPELEYDVQHDGTSFIIRTNLRNPNFRLMRASPEASSSENWAALLDPAEGAFLEDFEVVRGWVALKERVARAVRGRAVRLTDGRESLLGSCDPLHGLEFKDNLELGTSVIRYEQTSFIRPTITCDHDLETGATTILKEERVGGSFDSDAYVAEQRYVERPGTVAVPLTLLYRKDRSSAPGPVLLYGYGAYGFSIEPCLWMPRFSLLDRGFVFAIAHVRGGGELGRAWHEAGRCRSKPNSVADFIACAQYLRDSGIADPTSLFAMGESAGGFLVGAAINEQPDLFRAAVTVAPFVDVLNSLSDPTIPLTTTDFSEWGNPRNPEDHDLIRSYSPYNNIRRQAYPHILALARINDTQVAVWEPAKWLARIRDLSTSRTLHLLRTELNTGHMGRSGRYAQFWDTALAYAFLLGIHDGRLGRTS